MKVIFKQGVKESEIGSGVCSIASWANIYPYLGNIFAVKPNEEIIGIEVSEEGIKATFAKKK